MSKDLWLIEYEQACDAFADDEDEDALRARLKALGMDPTEIADEVAAAKGEL